MLESNVQREVGNKEKEKRRPCHLKWIALLIEKDIITSDFLY